MAPVKGSSQPNRAKKTSDKNAPRRPVSSYVLWLKDNREKLKRELASAKPAQHYAAFASERWKNLPLEERKPFEKLGSEDSARYQKELDEYKSSSEHAEFQQAKVSKRNEARKKASPTSAVISEQQHDLSSSLAPAVATAARKQAVTVGSAVKAKLPQLNPFCTASVAQDPPSKRRRVDTDDRLGAQLASPEHETVAEPDEILEAPVIDPDIARRAAIMRSAAAQASRSLHRLPGICKPRPVVKPVEILEAAVIDLDPPIFDRWWVKRRSLFAACLHADASDVEIEAEARRRWDLLTDDLRRSYDLPLRVSTSVTSASHENEDEVVEPGPPGFGRWLGLSGRRRKKVRIDAMFLPLYDEDGSWVPYVVRKRAEALRLWGNVSDKRRAKYAKGSQTRSAPPKVLKEKK